MTGSLSITRDHLYKIQQPVIFVVSDADPMCSIPPCLAKGPLSAFCVPSEKGPVTWYESYSLRLTEGKTEGDEEPIVDFSTPASRKEYVTPVLDLYESLGFKEGTQGEGISAIRQAVCQDVAYIDETVCIVLSGTYGSRPPSLIILLPLLPPQLWPVKTRRPWICWLASVGQGLLLRLHRLPEE